MALRSGRVGRSLRAVLLLALLAGMLAPLAGIPVARAQDATPAAEEAADPAVTPEATAEPSTPEPSPTPSPTPELPSPTPTSAATSTPEPSPAPPPSPSATAASTPAATATLSPSPTPTPEDAVQPRATTFTVTILPKDPDGQIVLSTCFELRRDAGNQTIGGLIKNVCDNGDTGRIVVQLGAGAYVLVETQQASRVARAQPKFFTVSGNRSLTVTHPWLIPIVVTARDAVSGALVPGGCYTVSLPGESYGTSACDGTDLVLDGVTTIPGFDRGTYEIRTEVLSEPEGYLPIEPQQFTIASLSAPFQLAVRHTRGATLTITTRDAGNRQLAGACYALGPIPGGPLPPTSAGPRCDAYDGAADGVTTLTGIPTGTYLLLQATVPTGYLHADDRQVALTNGQTTTTTVVNDLGGSIVVQARDDHGAVISDICPWVFADAGGTRGDPLYTTCQQGESTTDGETTIVGVATGDYILGQLTPQVGYVRAPDQRVSVTAGRSITVQLVSPLGGRITVRHRDGTGAALIDACVRVVQSNAGQRGAVVRDQECDAFDGTRDGVLQIVGLPAGSYLLVDLSNGQPFSPSADTPVSIAIRQTLEVTVTEIAFATLRLVRTDPGGQPLPGGCVDVYRGTERVRAAQCDGSRDALDGTLDIRLPGGDYEVRDGPPGGFIPLAPFPVTLTDATVTTVPITNDRMPRLTVRTVDGWGDPVPGPCVVLAPGPGNPDSESGGTYCDRDDTRRGGTIMTDQVLAPGDWLLASPDGSTFPFAPVEFTLAANESRSLDLVITLPAPVILLGPFASDVSQTGFTVYFTTDQKTVSTVELSLNGAVVATAPAEPESRTKTHRIAVTGLNPDTIYDLRLTTSNPNGSATREGLQLRTANAAGAIAVNLVTSAGAALTGSCFDLWTDAGNGALGSFLGTECDAFEADGDNGVVTFSGLGPGPYVVLQQTAPPGYRLAKSVRVTLTPRQRQVVPVTNTKGGYQVRIETGQIGGGPVPGACYSVFVLRDDGSIGPYVASRCDEEDGEDGITTLSGLPLGRYDLFQYVVPDGYLRADLTPIGIVRGQRGPVQVTVPIYAEADARVVSVRSLDAAGGLLPGACYGIYAATSGTALSPSGWIEAQCDGDDGLDDGVTHFVMGGGRYVLLEWRAPAGYAVGKKVAFTKDDAKARTVKVTQVAGGAPVVVSTLKGDGSSKLPGACYSLQRLVGSVWEFVTYACDAADGASDGVTTIAAVPAGSYRLVQTTTPAGYARPAAVTVSVGSGTKRATVRTYRS